MPLHPQASEFLQQQSALGQKPIDACTPAELREMLRRLIATGSEPEHVASIENRTAPGPAGPIPLRHYRPSATGIQPALVYFHGGGWVGGDLDSHDALCRAIANAAQCAVIAVDYRLAPEHKYPAAANDAYTATCWLRQQAAELGIDARRIAVGGDSAGGNLAAVVALMLRDRCQPAPCLQALLYPIIDHDFTTDSYRKYAEGFSLSRAGMQWFWRNYLASENDAQQPYAAPLRATDLRGLPPALVITAEYDVLCDEGESYARRLLSADVPTKLIRYDGMIHGFIVLPNAFDTAREAIVQIAAALNHAFAAIT